MPHFFKKPNSKEVISSAGWSLTMIGLWSYSFQQMIKDEFSKKNTADSNIENLDYIHPKND